VKESQFFLFKVDVASQFEIKIKPRRLSDTKIHRDNLRVSPGTKCLRG